VVGAVKLKVNTDSDKVAVIILGGPGKPVLGVTVPVADAPLPDAFIARI
jgi:hypothetical protein